MISRSMLTQKHFPVPPQVVSKTAWNTQVLAFTVSEAELILNKSLWIAFEPDNNNTYGVLIDDVSLAPVDIDFVFGFGPANERTTLENALSGMNPVFKEIQNDKSIFVIKGNPQGTKDAAMKDSKLWTIKISSSGDMLKSALSTTPYVVFCGHSNMGLGPLFVNAAAVTTTGSFLNIGAPQTAINVAYMMENEMMVNFKVPDADIPASVNNYWVLPNLLGANGAERYNNSDNKPPPNALPFNLKPAKARQYGYHFNRAGGNEYLIVDVPAVKRSKDLPKLGYQTFFYNACNTIRDYSEVFQTNKGSKFIASNVEVSAEWDQTNPPESQSNIIFAKKLMAGESWQVILDAMNKEQKRLDDGDNAYRIVDF